MTELSESALGRSVFAKIMEVEFGIKLHPDDRKQVREAFRCVQIFDSWQEFYEKTGWGRDNPETDSKEYLTENRICRIIGRRIWYFSRLEWEGSEI